MDELTAFDKIWLFQAASWVNFTVWLVLSLLCVPKLARANGESVLVSTILYIAVAMVILSGLFLYVSLNTERIAADTGPELIALFGTRVVAMAIAGLMFYMLYVVSRHRVKVVLDNIPLPDDEEISADLRAQRRIDKLEETVRALQERAISTAEATVSKLEAKGDVTKVEAKTVEVYVEPEEST